MKKSWFLVTVLATAALPAFAGDSDSGGEFKWSGRLQADSAWVDADEGDYNDARWRRFRFGFKYLFANDFQVHLEADIDLNDELSDSYNRLTDANVSWKAGDKGKIKLLKQGAGFTLDGQTSSKKLLTTERNNLTNNLWFTAEYFTGASFSSSTQGGIDYQIAAFSSDGNDEFSKGDASYFLLGTIGHDFAGEDPSSGLSKNHWHFHYVYNDEDIEANTRDFSQVISVVNQAEWDDWGLWSDLSYGEGHLDQSDVIGLVVMPFYSFNEKYQLIGRYTYIESGDNNGVRLNRYENRAVDGRGDQYNEFHLGFNVFFDEHKVKAQFGWQYASMDDAANDGGEYDGWSLTAAARLYW